MALTKPDINLTCEHDGQEWVISLLADRLTRQVHLSFSANNDTDESGVVNFSDNFFDLLPNESKSVRIRMQGEAGQEQASFLPKLQVMSLVDSYDLEENKNNNEFTTY